MQQVILEPQNPRDLQRDELEELAQAIRDLDIGLEVCFAEEREHRGYGVTYWEVLYISLSVGAAVGGKVVDKILDVAIDWARKRFSRKSSRRPKYVAIYGPDGKVLRSVLLAEEMAEPEDRTVVDREQPPRRLPPIVQG